MRCFAIGKGKFLYLYGDKKRRKSMKLVFVADFSEQFPNRILRGIRKFSQETGEPWVVCRMPSTYVNQIGFQEFFSWTKKWKADIVLAPFNPDDPVEEFRNAGIAAIALDNIHPFTQIPNLTGNYEAMGEMAATRFIARGFTNFAFFGYHGLCWSDGRRRGFENYLESQGLKDNYQEGVRLRTDNLWSYDEARLGYWLLSLPKPIGIMVCDDTQANILLECCRTFDISVPGDVAVIGVDNDEVQCSMTDPPLSSVDVDLERGGYALASMAARMVREPEYPGEDIVLQPLGIVTRKSSSIVVTRDKNVQEAIRFISENIQKKIQVKDILEHVPMSRRSLEQRFMKETGKSVYDFITRMRIDVFSQMLLSSEESVAALAAKMDEPDAKSISRRFKALKGCTPSEFRSQHLRNLGV